MATITIINTETLKVVQLEPQQVKAIIDFLGPVYTDDIVGKAPLDLELGLDFLLEGLGREGHFGD
jgi:hypothetical protein